MRLKGERSAHLGGDGGKNASLEPNLWEEHPWEQKRQPTMDEVRQCVFGGHPSHAHTLIDFSRVVSIDVFRPCFGFLLDPPRTWHRSETMALARGGSRARHPRRSRGITGWYPPLRCRHPERKRPPREGMILIVTHVTDLS